MSKTLKDYFKPSARRSCSPSEEQGTSDHEGNTKQVACTNIIDCINLYISGFQDPPPQKSPLLDFTLVVSSRDIHMFISKRATGTCAITDTEMYQLFKNHFEPSPDYKFPKGEINKRSFKYKWLLQFKPLLVYSEQANGDYYLPCVLFATSCNSCHLV